MSLAALVVAAGLCAAARPSHAQVPTLLKDCSIEVDAVEFSNYDAFTASPNRSTGTVRVSCKEPAPAVSVELSAGVSGDYQRRTMTSSTGSLNYNLYTDEGHSIVAGDGTGGTSPLRSVTLTRNPKETQRFNVYGEIAPRQLAPTGDYLDIVRLTVVF